MTHYTLLVKARNLGTRTPEEYLNDVLEPYNEDIKVIPYIDMSWKKVLKDKKEAELKDDKYKKMTKEAFVENYYGIDENFITKKGILSNYNPNSKWDWFVIGGRWEDNIIPKNICKIKDLTTKQLKGLPKMIYAVLDNGIWYEPNKMLYFGITSATKKQESDFKKSFYKKFLENEDKETTLILVDCHI